MLGLKLNHVSKREPWSYQKIFCYWGRDKMAAIFQTTFSNVVSWENVWITIDISLTFVPKGPIDNNPALVWIMAWRRIDDKLLSEPMLIRFIDAYISRGGNRTMVAAATIVIMAAAKKAQQNVFALYRSYNRTILLGFIWILDFNFKIVFVLRRRYLISIRGNNGQMVALFWFSALTMVVRVGDDGCIISGG